MPYKDLKNKPLVEAILELRWTLESGGPGVSRDPHYRLLLGRFSERVQEEYSSYGVLPTANFPDEMVAHIVQHQFRVKQNAWPLLQIGPGIITVNDTDGYTWTDFQRRCEGAVAKLVDAHPKASDLMPERITLRYIDAVDFDHTKDNILGFLSDKMKVRLELPENLFADGLVSTQPSAFNWQVSFPLTKPKGTVSLRSRSKEKATSANLGNAGSVSGRSTP